MVEDRMILRPNKVIFYQQPERRDNYDLKCTKPYQQPNKSIQYDRNGNEVCSEFFGWSHESKKKLSNSLNTLYAISDNKRVYSKLSKKSFWFKLNFITVTLSDKQKHSDKFIKDKLLEPFLKWMQYNHAMNSYVWRAETQINGNIHFHITTNIFIHYKAIRNAWNKIQLRHGYIDSRWSMIDDDVPNSTDVRSIKDAKACIKYLSKYVTKEQKDRRQVTGQYWNCSMNLKQSAPNLLTTAYQDVKQYQEWREKNPGYYYMNDFVELDFTTHEQMLQMPEKLRRQYIRWLEFVKRNDDKTKVYYLDN